ncbi:MAG: ATP-dependent Clp protease adaptor ClpS [bacterium]
MDDKMTNEMADRILDDYLFSVKLTDDDVDVDSINEILNELGIRSSNSDEYKLVLWNDHVNDMMHVVVALYEVCKLSEKDCVRVMMEAHEKGKAVVKSGTFDEMNTLKIALNDRNLEATVE